MKGQAKRTKKNCRKILLKNPEKILLTNHKIYVLFDPKNLPGNQYYHGKDCPIQCQIKEAEKHYERFFIWQCLNLEVCVSDSIIAGTVTGKVYLQECLKKKLIPFIRKHRKIEKKTSYFGWTWHGMASSHYCKDFIEWLESINIQLIAKKDNAPKVCSTRPIERFWALRKGKQIQLNL